MESLRWSAPLWSQLPPLLTPIKVIVTWYMVYDKGSKQPLAQMAGALITLAVALICGSGVGILLKAMPGRGRFTDSDTWTVAAGFDKIE